MTARIKAVDERLDEYLKRLDEDDAKEAGTGGSRTKNLTEKTEALRTKRGRCGALLNDLECSGEEQISLTDPDSRAMAADTVSAHQNRVFVTLRAHSRFEWKHSSSQQLNACAAIHGAL